MNFVTEFPKKSFHENVNHRKVAFYRHHHLNNHLKNIWYILNRKPFPNNDLNDEMKIEFIFVYLISKSWAIQENLKIKSVKALINLYQNKHIYSFKIFVGINRKISKIFSDAFLQQWLNNKACTHQNKPNDLEAKHF